MIEGTRQQYFETIGNRSQASKTPGRATRANVTLVSRDAIEDSPKAGAWRGSERGKVSENHASRGLGREPPRSQTRDSTKSER